MARKRYTAEQIIGKLREAEVALAQGESVAKVARRLGVAEQTYYRWRREYGGLRLDQAKRFKELEQENARLKRLVAVAPEAAGKGDDPGDQSRLVRGHLHGVPLRAARLPAGPTLRDGQRGSHVRNRLPPARRAQKFPDATSLRMAWSSA